MKKRIFALCSALLLSLTVFAGCGSKPTEESAASEPEATATAAPTAEAESSAAESTAEPTEAPSTEPANVNLLTGLPVGAVTVAINAPLFIWAWKQLGKRFVGLTLLCMLTSSLLIDLLAHFPYTVTEEPMLAAVYGGLISGAGYGLCYTSGATAGGTDIPSRMLRRRYPHINMTTFILLFNLVIIVTFAALFHRFDSCMYTLICMYITNKVDSLILYGPVNSRLCYIISDKSADLSAAITGPNWYSMNAKLLSSAGQSERTCPAILMVWSR